jgi:hypothetical protein
MIPMNSTAAYIDPMALNKSCDLLLDSEHEINKVFIVADCLHIECGYHDLHFATKVPKDGAEEKSNDGSKKEPYGIVGRIPPV